jgi:hypothetical protein
MAAYLGKDYAEAELVLSKLRAAQRHPPKTVDIIGA